MHREVLAGSKARVPEELWDVLPELMRLAQMRLVLYWIFDRTEGCESSYRLAQRGARLTARDIALARLRVLGTLVHEVHEPFTDFLPGMTKALRDPAGRAGGAHHGQAPLSAQSSRRPRRPSAPRRTPAVPPPRRRAGPGIRTRDRHRYEVRTRHRNRQVVGAVRE